MIFVIFLLIIICALLLKGNLDKASPNAGYVLLMFYHLYDGKACKFNSLWYGVLR